MLMLIHIRIKLATDLYPKATTSITLGKDFLDNYDLYILLQNLSLI